MPIIEMVDLEEIPESFQREIQHFDLGEELQRRILLVLSSNRCFVSLVWIV
jgi:hypothetical protein